MNTRTVGNSDPMTELFAEHRRVLVDRAEMIAALQACSVCFGGHTDALSKAVIAQVRAALAKVA